MLVSVLRLRQRAWCAIWTLALRSSSLSERVYELSELALDRLSRLCSTSQGRDKTARWQATKVLLTRTARPERSVAASRDKGGVSVSPSSPTSSGLNWPSR